MAERSCTASALRPRRSSSQTAKRRSWVGVTSTRSSSSSLHCSNAPPVRVSNLRSRPRTAFISAAAKLRPIPIASPVDFICVPRRVSASGNLSNGQRGNFTTQ